MSYTIALNSFPNSLSSIFSPSIIDWSKKSYSERKPSYTTIYTKELVHNLSYKSKATVLKIESFKNLEENWDSYGAERPAKISIENAKEFIKEADKDGLEIYFTAPGRNGDVLVEFQLNDKISAEVYFNNDGTNELLIFDGTECITEGTVENNYNDLIAHKNGFRS